MNAQVGMKIEAYEGSCIGILIRSTTWVGEIVKVNRKSIRVRLTESTDKYGSKVMGHRENLCIEKDLPLRENLERRTRLLPQRRQPLRRHCSLIPLKTKTEETTMKKIELFERAIAERAERLQDYGINSTAFWAYRKSIDAGNDLIDFSDVIWDYDIEAIAQTFADSGITEFTISSRFSDLIPTLAAFDKLGFKMAGMTEVNAAYTDWQTGKHPRLPAIRLERR